MLCTMTGVVDVGVGVEDGVVEVGVTETGVVELAEALGETDALVGAADEDEEAGEEDEEEEEEEVVVLVLVALEYMVSRLGPPQYSLASPPQSIVHPAVAGADPALIVLAQ